MASHQRDFVKALAKFLVDGQASKSIRLEMGEELAKEWAALRQTTPIFGYPTVEEAEKILLEWLMSSWTATPPNPDKVCGRLSFARPGRTCPLPYGHDGGHDFGLPKCAWPCKPPCKGRPLKGLTMCRKHQPFPAKASGKKSNPFKGLFGEKRPSSKGPSVQKMNGRKPPSLEKVSKDFDRTAGTPGSDCDD